ncbi:MAG: nucleotide sugar dehydrogenase [Bacilli bacterium]|nr:nucleotide sugar dehydrogenase [Bacilli bacterium]
MKINVIGLGYIGLPTALMFATHGVEVVGTDYNEELVKILNEGKTTFDEKGLDELFNEALKSNIKFTTEYQHEDIYIVSVPTPYEKENKKIDPKYVVSAVETVLENCNKGAILIIESTISPGTIDKFVRPVITKKGFKIGKDIHLVHAPERIIPGNMVYELENNSRTIGADEKEIGEKVKKLYSSFCKGEIVVTDIKTAEMTKVVENTFRDINIAFANELSRICRDSGMDVYEVIKIANRHPRVNILQPGPGVGGHCISVDPWFLVGDYPEIVNVIKAAREVNDGQPRFVLERLKSIMEENQIKDITKVGIYGLTYKENVDDIRESPTLQMLEVMGDKAKEVKVYDPCVRNKIIENQYDDFEKFINDIDIIVIMNSHNHIKDNLDKISNKIILDTKNICNTDKTYKL